MKINILYLSKYYLFNNELKTNIALECHPYFIYLYNYIIITNKNECR